MTEDDLVPPPMQEVYAEKQKKSLFNIFRRKKKSKKEITPEQKPSDYSFQDIPEGVPIFPTNPVEESYDQFVKEENKRLKEVQDNISSEQKKDESSFDLKQVPIPPSPKEYLNELEGQPQQKPVRPKQAVFQATKEKKDEDGFEKEIEKYFAQMEKEQLQLKKELDKIVPGIKPLKLKSGEQVRSLKQLKDAIEKLDKKTFDQHTKNNDFYKWIKNILEEEELAEKLREKILKKDVLSVLRQNENSLKKTIRSKEMTLLKDKRFRQGLVNELRLKIEELHDFAINLSKKEEYLKKEKEKTQKEKEKLAKDKIDFKKDVQEAKKLLKKAEKLKPQEKKLKTTEARIKKETLELEEKQKRLEEGMAEKRKIATYFKNVENNLKQERGSLENKGFEKFVKSKLREIGSISFEDENLKEKPAIKGEDYFELYKKIDDCRTLIDTSRLEEAKKAYQELKQDFYKAKMGPREKQMLHNAIREIYDDIQLELIERY